MIKLKGYEICLSEIGYYSRVLAVVVAKVELKTNISINLALTLINNNQTVALLDADLGL